MASRFMASHSWACTAAALAVLGLAAHPAQAQTTTLNGSYSGNSRGDGYDTTSGGSYIVTPTATFNNNSGTGLFVGVNGTVTVNGGTFSKNGDAGLYNFVGTVTVNGGTFSDNKYGVDAIYEGSSVGVTNIYGGTFSGNTTDLYAYGSETITLYGTFSQYGLLPEPTSGGNGTFTGTLADGGGLQTFTYYDDPGSGGGGIFLVNAPAAVPEASTTVSFGLLLALGLGGVVLARKKRAVI